MKRVCVVTGTRAEYGLLQRLMWLINKSAALELQVIVTGMHLSPEFGLTYRKIEQDGFRIDAKVDMLLSSDSSSGTVKSIGIALLGFADAYERLAPDIVLLLGDRYEILAAAEAAYVMGLPVAHLAGGDVTEGAIDDGIRHAVTKFSLLHFVSTDVHRKRVIQLGEDPQRVFHVGFTGIDNIGDFVGTKPEAVMADLSWSFKRPLFVITYHPSTLGEPPQAFYQLLLALNSFRDASLLFTYPNSDAGGRALIRMINDFAEDNRDRVYASVSLGRELYLRALSVCNLVLGNSSSGLYEAPSFGVPTVNVGMRQQGRIRADSVIDVAPERDAIEKAIRFALSDEFVARAKTAENPYGSGGSSQAILEILEREDFSAPRKTFYDLDLAGGSE